MSRNCIAVSSTKRFRVRRTAGANPPPGSWLLILFLDDGIVVGMTTKEYLYTPETNRRRELVHGVVREPPAPFFSHQRLVLKIARLLSEYVERRGLGEVGIAPVDVILDATQALVVQPDVLFVSAARSSIVEDQVWGAPDVVVEILSSSTALRDRTEKLQWYRQYGVRECWLVDPARERVTIADFSGAFPETRVYDREAIVQSTVIQDFSTPAASLLP